MYASQKRTKRIKENASVGGTEKERGQQKYTTILIIIIWIMLFLACQNDENHEGHTEPIRKINNGITFIFK